MARAQTRHDWSDQQRAPGNEWQQLRHDLVSLLDQVEQQQPAPGPAARPQHSVHVDETSRRRSEALRSVKQAVDRFAVSDRDSYLDEEEYGLPDDNPRAALRDAIDQIRSKTDAPRSYRTVRRVREPEVFAEKPQSAGGMPQFSELARAVSGISGRLERLEMELRASRKSEADIAEISKQVSQLTNVVEMVAGAVGETSQIKRLEKQIGQLASTLAQAPKTDTSALTRRIDEVAATVDRLAEMQVQQMGRDAREAPVDLSGLDASMETIEASVRNIYDRIDALERSFSLSPQDIERLTTEMAEFTQALRDGSGGAPSLLSRVDALNARLGQLEDAAGEGSLGDIRADVSALRDAVSEAMEPRFAAIESQIEALSGRMNSGAGGGDLDVAQLEDQIRQLAQRMDQTGEQLTGLTRLYEQDGGGTQDYEALAAMVAQRTSQEMAQAGGNRNLSDDSVAQLEERLSRLFTAGGQSDSSEEIADMRAGIEQVDARLERLEAVLSVLGDNTAARAAPAAPYSDVGATSSMSVDDKPASSPASRVSLQPDSMPNNPGDEAPLRDPGFPPPQATENEWEKMEVASSLRDPSEAVSNAAKSNAGDADTEPPRFDPETVERPGRPKSSFDDEQPVAFAEAADEESDMDPAPEWPQSSQPQQPTGSEDGPQVTADRNTFIAAARRAAIRQQEAPTETPSGNSLIGRAFARLQQKKETDAEAQPAPLPEPSAEERPGRHSYTLSADEDEESKPSMLSRHRRPILLAAALVAVSLLTLNLVTQRMSSGTATVSAPAPAATQPDAPSVAATNDPGVDDTSTNSIDPMVKMDLMKPSPAGQPLPMMLQQGAATPDLPLSSEFTTGSIRPIDTVADAGATEQPEPSPIKHELAPEEIGPLALREAAADGDSRAQFEIAAIYAEGQSVEQDFEAAATWYERAAAQGFAPAAYRLGTLYEHGRGLDRDLQQAKLWYQRAADAGNRMAMHNLAAIHAGGELDEQDFSTAAQWFQAAAERGMMDSQFNLGMLYARGLGVPQNLEQSYKWFSLAAAQGDEDAAKARDDVTRSLDADSVITLQEEVASWAAQPIDMQANFAPIGTWDTDFNPGDPITERSVIEKVQAALSRLGFDLGTPDGVMGPKTRDAIKAFESATGMSESGAVNPRLLAVLGSQPV